MRRKRLGSTIAAAGVTLSLALGGCGEGQEEATPAPTGPLAEALATTGGGGAHGSLGVGWAEPALVRKRGLEAELVAAALGPNAGSVVDSAPRLRRRFGLDPLAAERLTSVGGSYAFGLRLDGVDGRSVREALIESGGRARDIGRSELIDVGPYAVVPQPLLDAGVRGLGAFDAVGGDEVVLAISETARASLLGRGDRLLDEPTYRAAARCLGDVAVARMVPDKLLLSAEQGVDLLAVGVREPGDEVLCVLGGTAERSDEVASNLEASLAPGARDPVSGEPIGDAVAAVDVARTSDESVETIRANLTLAAREEPGYILGAIPRGSLVGLINAADEAFTRRPDSEAFARGLRGDR